MAAIPRGPSDEDIRQVHHGEVPDYRTVAMELVWRCLRCGFLLLKPQTLPDRCPACGAPKEEFMAVVED